MFNQNASRLVLGSQTSSTLFSISPACSLLSRQFSGTGFTKFDRLAAKLEASRQKPNPITKSPLQTLGRAQLNDPETIHEESERWTKYSLMTIPVLLGATGLMFYREFTGEHHEKLTHDPQPPFHFYWLQNKPFPWTKKECGFFDFECQSHYDSKGKLKPEFVREKHEPEPEWLATDEEVILGLEKATEHHGHGHGHH